VQWSELQRDSKGVAALADEGDVRVRRRDGAALLLTREDRAHSASEGSVAALLDEFPWVDVLPEAEQAQFVKDFARAFQASAELGQWSVLAQTITEWRSTAAIHADPALAGKLTGPIDGDFG
jgi:hypothetical protein